MCALKNVKEVELIGMGKLKKCVLMGGLKNVKSVRMENAGKLESVKGLKEAMEEEAERRKKEEEERKKKEEERKREEMMALAKANVNVRNVGDLQNVDISVQVIAVTSYSCNDSELNVLDLSQFVNLKELKVGDECFASVNKVKLIGLNRLERVDIGENSFTKEKSSYRVNANGRFYLKNCERMRELKIGWNSFNGYSVCEIENVPSLEVIEMGVLNERSYNFYYASLELKSDFQRMQ